MSEVEKMTLFGEKSCKTNISNKAVKKVTVFYRTEFENTIFDDTTLSVMTKQIKGDYEYDVDMNVVPNIILDYMSTPHAQELLEYSLVNLTSIAKKDLPEEFKTPHWKERGSRIISSLSLGCHFFSNLTHGYYITFAYIMSQFITDELWDRLISDAVLIPAIIKKEDVKKHVSVTHYLRCLLDTDCSPERLVVIYPNDPKKIIEKMAELYHDYFNIEHLDIEAHTLAVARCLLLAIVQAILDSEQHY